MRPNTCCFWGAAPTLARPSRIWGLQPSCGGNCHLLSRTVVTEHTGRPGWLCVPPAKDSSHSSSGFMKTSLKCSKYLHSEHFPRLRAAACGHL